MAPRGLNLDLVVVTEDGASVDLAALLGPTTEPDLPFHCTEYDGLGFQIETRNRSHLLNIRQQQDDAVFAMQESVPLLDPSGFLASWKRSAFVLSPEQVRSRSLGRYFRFQYLTGDYREEKWTHRSAWTQLAQIGNEAAECFCAFLHCVNGGFVPRKDWLTYLTYELSDRPADHALILERIYSADPQEAATSARFAEFRRVGEWMTSYCKIRDWL